MSPKMKLYNEAKCKVLDVYKMDLLDIQDSELSEEEMDKRISILDTKTIGSLTMLSAAQYSFIKHSGLWEEYSEFLNELHLESIGVGV